MSHNIILNEGDAITEDAIRTILGRSAVSGYVEQETLGITYREDGTVDVEPGEVHILHNRQDITIETDAFTGHGLVANAENTLWIVVDPGGATDDDAVSLVSNATGVEPSDPSIEIATVDTNRPPQDPDTVDPSNRGTAAGLDGEDINPRSIGDGERVWRIFAELVDAATVTADSYTGGGADLDAVDARAGSFENLTAGSIDADRSNGVHHLDPDRDDFGAALLEVLPNCERGDVIMVPPVNYLGPHTPVTIDGPGWLTIKSQRLTGRERWRLSRPRISDSDGMDGPFITSLVQIGIGGLAFGKDADVEDGNNAIQCHKTCYIDGIAADDIDGNVIQLANNNTTDNDNCNNSIIKNVSGQGCKYDVVHLHKTEPATRNNNGCRIHVTTAKDCGGYGINFGSSFGDHGIVDHAAGGKGGIRFGGYRTTGEVLYAGDGLDHGVAFANEPNGVELVHTGGPMEDHVGLDEYPNNHVSYGYPSRTDFDFISRGKPYRIDGEVELGKGKGILMTSADGSRWRARLNNNGEWNTQRAE